MKVATPKGQKERNVKINRAPFLNNKGIHYSEEEQKHLLIFKDFCPLLKDALFLSLNYIILICLHSEPIGDYKEALS